MKNIEVSLIMKTNKILAFFTVVTMAFALTSCVQDDDFSVPQSLGNEENAKLEQLLQDIENGTVAEITIPELKALYIGENQLIQSEIAVKGYVSSSDATGNFYREFYMQDATENPTAAIGVMVNQVDTYNFFNQGREVYIYLKGLYIGENSSNIISIGGSLDEENYLDNISESRLSTHVLRSANTAELMPLVLSSPSEVNASHLGVFATLQNVQFPEAYAGSTFHNPNNDFDTRYPLMSCDDGTLLQLETSSFANFGQQPLPTGLKGSISGVIAQGYGGSPMVMLLNTPDDINFTEEGCAGVELTPNLTISELRDMYSGNNVLFPASSDYIVEGYVVSNDKEGNFYKNIFIQDLPENPTAAIQILADDYDLFNSYGVGDKVYIKLARLYLGQSYGVMSLGTSDGDYIGRLPEGVVYSNLVNSGESTDIVPTLGTIASGMVTIDELDEEGNPVDDNNDGIPNQVPAPQGILLKLDNVQLDGSELGNPYAFYNSTESANRTITSCENSSSIIMRNSGFATFAQEEFPMQRGYVLAVNSAYNGTNQLVIRDTDDVVFDQARCEPFFEENFSSVVDGTILDIEGWINYAEAGSVLWMGDVYNGNGYARFNPYNSGNSSNIAWLITPGIDMDAQSGEVLTFQTEHAYPDTGHDPLEVMISTDFDGTEAGITTATWEPLTFDVSYLVNSSSWYTFTSSGSIDLSGYIGTAYIAFRYTGSDTANQNMTLDIDNIQLSIQ